MPNYAVAVVVTASPNCIAVHCRRLTGHLAWESLAAGKDASWGRFPLLQCVGSHISLSLHPVVGAKLNTCLSWKMVCENWSGF